MKSVRHLQTEVQANLVPHPITQLVDFRYTISQLSFRQMRLHPILLSLFAQFHRVSLVALFATYRYFFFDIHQCINCALSYISNGFLSAAPHNCYIKTQKHFLRNILCHILISNSIVTIVENFVVLFLNIHRYPSTSSSFFSASLCLTMQL